MSTAVDPTVCTSNAAPSSPAPRPTLNRPLNPQTDYTRDGRDFSYEHARHHEGSKQLPYDASLLHGGQRSLSSIGLQAFGLGFALAGCLFGSAWLAIHSDRTWRLPAFFACLSLFHFLEYYTTARWNTPVVRASSFLLYNNGMAYNIAHGLATVEMVVAAVFFPRYQTWLVSWWTVAAGIILVVVGQVVRSVAMAQAGTNFNHLPVQTRLAGHELVTHGVYSVFRHPSYFGFFWWAIGTQIMVGNKVCLVGYTLILWKFFKDRIISEEKNLIVFFGKNYEDFRQRTGTGIPLIK